MNTSPPIAVVNIPGTFFGPHPGAKNVAATPGSLISTLLPNIMVIAAVIFFLIIIYYGFNMIVMSGRFQRGSPDDARELAKKRGILNSALFIFYTSDTDSSYRN